MIHHLKKVLALWGFVHRLRTKPEMIADILRWQPFQIRQLHLQLLITTIQPPHQWGHPRKTPFNQHHFQIWKLFKHAFIHQTRHLSLKCRGHATVILNIMRRLTRTCNWTCASTAKMNRNGQPVSHRSLIHLPILAIAQGFHCPHNEKHLHKSRIIAPAVNFCRSQFAIFIRHNHRPAQPGFAPEPRIGLPIIHSLSHRLCITQILLPTHADQRRQNTVIYIPLIQQLRAQKFQIGSRRSRRRPCIVTRGIWHGAGIPRPDASATTNGSVIIVPFLRQILKPHIPRFHSNVNIAINHGCFFAPFCTHLGNQCIRHLMPP